MITDIVEIDVIVLHLLFACLTLLHLLIQEIASGHWKTIGAGDSFGLSTSSHGLYFRTIHDIDDRSFTFKLLAKDPQKLVNTEILEIDVDIHDPSNEISISCRMPICPPSNMTKINITQQITWRTLHEPQGISVTINDQKSVKFIFRSCHSFEEPPDYEAFRNFYFQTEQTIEFLVYEKVESSIGEC